MSRRRRLGEHLRSLSEINGILNAMKNLSMMELRKLARFSGNQRKALLTIESAATDFFSFHPRLARPAGPRARKVFEIQIAIGSERGFCAEFNELILKAVGSEPVEKAPLVVVVGRKLSIKMAGNPLVVARLDGATVAEEVPSILLRVLDTIKQISVPGRRTGELGITATYSAEDGVQSRKLLPLHHFAAGKPRYPHPPLLNMKPLLFARELVDQYLFAALSEAFMSSLAAENRRRLQHLDGAIHHLERSIETLRTRYNSLRQEEITQEIEVIMLSAEELLTRSPSG